MLHAKEDEIRRLTNALEIKGKVIKCYDAYYDIAEDGKAFGDPYCLNCWESSHVLRHLSNIPGSRNKECPACKHKYDSRRVHTQPIGEY